MSRLKVPTNLVSNSMSAKAPGKPEKASEDVVETKKATKQEQVKKTVPAATKARQIAHGRKNVSVNLPTALYADLMKRSLDLKLEGKGKQEASFSAVTEDALKDLLAEKVVVAKGPITRPVRHTNLCLMTETWKQASLAAIDSGVSVSQVVVSALEKAL